MFLGNNKKLHQKGKWKKRRSKSCVDQCSDSEIQRQSDLFSSLQNYVFVTSSFHDESVMNQPFPSWNFLCRIDYTLIFIAHLAA
jgi:hypothetical protein